MSGDPETWLGDLALIGPAYGQEKGALAERFFPVRGIGGLGTDQGSSCYNNDGMGCYRTCTANLIRT